MSLFEIITNTVFENVYLIEADNFEEAKKSISVDEYSPEFYQLFIGEHITHSSELCSGEPTDDDIEIAHTSIKDRGYA